jgi:hypothetical protein
LIVIDVVTSANVMPSNFGQTLTPPQLQQLVAYLQQATGGGGGK